VGGGHLGDGDSGVLREQRALFVVQLAGGGAGRVKRLREKEREWSGREEAGAVCKVVEGERGTRTMGSGLS